MSNKTHRICLIMNYNWVGGIYYIINIVKALSSLHEDVQNSFELYLITNAKLNNDIEKYLKKIYYFEKDLKPYSVKNRILWKLRRKFLNEETPQLNDFLNNRFDFVYPHFSHNTKNGIYRSAVWIYDLQHKHLPQLFSEQDIKLRDKTFYKFARLSEKIVLSSKTSELDFLNFYPQAKCKTHVLPFSLLPLDEWYNQNPSDVQEKYNLPDKFFLVSNQFWQHKNHIIILDSLKMLKNKSIFPSVVFTGNTHDYRNPNYFDSFLQRINFYGINDQIFILGLLPRIEQIQLIRRCISIIQPSLFEGWSSIVEDGRAFGKKMIISDIPVHQEQNPLYVKFFNSDSPEELADIIVDYWKNTEPGPDLSIEVGML